MKVNRSRQAFVISLALSLAGCEFIGPQIHTKLPLPELPPTIDDSLTVPQVVNPDENKKTTKVEMFPSEGSALYPSVQTSQDEKSSGKGEFSLNFDDADLGEVAKVILSDILGKNYTLSPEVAGKVTLQTTKPLTRDELLPTLDMLLSINNAAIVLQNGLYVIKPSADAIYNTSFKSFGSSSTMPGGYQVRIVPVKNVAANEIADILKPMLPEKSLLHVDPKRNILMLAGTAAELNRAIDLVNTFDIDVLKGRSFALFTPAHVDASVIIEELEQIFNNTPASPTGAGGAGKKDKEAPSAAASASGGDGGFFRFIEIDRLNAILAITHKQHFLHDIETWVLRLDKTNSEGKGGVNVYKAQHHSAADLAQTLGNIFGTGGGQGSRGASIAAGRRSLSASNRSGTGSNSAGSSGGGFGSNTLGGMNNNSSGFGNSSGGGFSGTNQSNSSGFGGGSAGAFGSNNSTTGANTSFGGGGQPLMPNVKIIADENNNALIIVANAQEYATILKVLKQLDVLPLQVLIDATIVEVTLKDDLSYGIEWYFTHYNGGTNTIAGGAGGKNIANLQSIGAGIATGGLSYLFTNPSQNIGALLQAQATNNNVNVISSPSLMVLNNQEATIKVGDSVPVLSGTSTFTTGVATTNTIQMVDTGVNLSIRPRVNANGLVLMDLMQSVNAAVATTATSTINSPTIQKREIQTNVAVQSGETIVLGGLIREENDYNRNGVPWLHEIPYIGPLFGGTTRNKDKTELVILLTPRVMKTRQDAQDVTEEFKRKLTGIYEDKIKVEVEVIPEQNIQ